MSLIINLNISLIIDVNMSLITKNINNNLLKK